MVRMFEQIVDNQQPRAWATRLRRKRFALFTALIAPLPRPLRILDVGGTQQFWEMMGFTDEPGIDVVVYNLEHVVVDRPHFHGVVGDARHMHMFPDHTFDVVFSNSVIEHVGTAVDQQRMAHEVQRVGHRYFVQTPNRWFPIEPHFVFPCFQFLPVSRRAWLVQHFDLGWFQRVPEPAAARTLVQSIRLLSGSQFQHLFPEATLYQERVGGLVKSFVAYHGFAGPASSTAGGSGFV